MDTYIASEEASKLYTVLPVSTVKCFIGVLEAALIDCGDVDTDTVVTLVNDGDDNNDDDLDDDILLETLHPEQRTGSCQYPCSPRSR